MAATARLWPIDKLEFEFIRWRLCIRRCPPPSRRNCPCRHHHSRPRSARRSDRNFRDTISLFSIQNRPLSSCKTNGEYYNNDSDVTAFRVKMNNYWLIDFVLWSKTKLLFKNHTFIQFTFNFVFNLLYFTIPYFTSNKYNVQSAMTSKFLNKYDRALTHDKCGLKSFNDYMIVTRHLCDWVLLLTSSLYCTYVSI